MVLSSRGNVTGDVNAAGGGVGTVMAATGAVTGNVDAGKSITMVLGATGIGDITRSTITAGDTIGVVMSTLGDIRAFISAGSTSTRAIGTILASRGTLTDSRVRSAGGIGAVIVGSISDTLIAAKNLWLVQSLGNVTRSVLAGGYDFGADGEVGGGDDTLTSGRIGTVLVVGDMSESSVTAGVGPGQDGMWGSDDDVSAADGDESRIGVVMVLGALLGNANAGDRFGILATDGTFLLRAGTSFLRADAPPQPFDDTNVYVGIV